MCDFLRRQFGLSDARCYAFLCIDARLITDLCQIRKSPLVLGGQLVWKLGISEWRKHKDLKRQVIYLALVKVLFLYAYSEYIYDDEEFINFLLPNVEISILPTYLFTSQNPWLFVNAKLTLAPNCPLNWLLLEIYFTTSSYLCACYSYNLRQIVTVLWTVFQLPLFRRKLPSGNFSPILVRFHVKTNDRLFYLTDDLVAIWCNLKQTQFW